MNTLKHSLQLLWKRPGFALLVVLILGFGIGINTAVFSLVDAIVLHPLPYPDADRLVFAWAGDGTVPFSYPNFVDLRDGVASLEGASVFVPISVLMGEEDAERLPGELVSGDFFGLFRVTPVRGRVFTAEEEKDDGTRVALISYALWQRRFSGAEDVVGKTLLINSEQVTVVGILPEGFRGVTGKADLWLPVGMLKIAIAQLAQFDPLPYRGVRWHAVVGRLKAGVTPEAVSAELAAWSHRMAEEYPEPNDDLKARVVPMAEQLVGGLKAPLLLLQAAVAFVLLIACTNLANMLLARALERQRELAIRSALGASRSGLMAQLLAETMVLALLGGALGVLLTFSLTKVMSRALTGQIPGYVHIGVNPSVLLFTLAVSLVTGLVVGLLPALRFTRPELTTWLKEGGATTVGTAGQLIRNALVVVEVAVAMLLLVGSLLLMQGFQRLQDLDTGFTPENRVEAHLDLPSTRYTDAQVLVAADQLISTLEGNAAVRSAAVGSDLPLGDLGTVIGMTIEGFDPAPEDTVKVHQHSVSPGYFRTLGIELKKGRTFTTQDSPEAPLVAVVSEGFAQHFWPGEDPMGKRVKYGNLTEESPWISIVGVVGNVRYRDLLQDPSDSLELYQPFAQSPAISFYVVAHTELAPEGLVGQIRQMLQGQYPGVPVYDVATLPQKVRDATATMRLASNLMGFFAFAALVLAGIGLYAVIAYSVRQRRREMGIRMALGARSRGVALLVLRRGFLLTVAGLALGAVPAYFAARALAGKFFGVEIGDPSVWAGVALLLLAASILASLLPAWAASRIQPVQILRQE